MESCIVYNAIGENYNRNRTADKRIVDTLIRLLNLPRGSVVADIGAGTGNYSNALADAGYRVEAIEPSHKMRGQASPHKNVTWISGVAEAIPLADNCVDGVIVVLALHHFASLRNAVSEMQRICPRGPIVIFTLDPREGQRLWIDDYFHDICKKDVILFKPVGEISGMIAKNGTWHITAESFPLPHDLADRNMLSAWREPERYLDDQFRQNTFGFALASVAVVEEGVLHLKHDLSSGRWDARYGNIRNQTHADCGFIFVKGAYESK